MLNDVTLIEFEKPIIRLEHPFEVISEYHPAFNQRRFMNWQERLRAGEQDIVLLGATGTAAQRRPADRRSLTPGAVSEGPIRHWQHPAGGVRRLLPNNAVSTLFLITTTIGLIHVPQTDTFTRRTPRSTMKSGVTVQQTRLPSRYGCCTLCLMYLRFRYARKNTLHG